jgi:hypothetical protein
VNRALQVSPGSYQLLEGADGTCKGINRAPLVYNNAFRRINVTRFMQLLINVIIIQYLNNDLSDL